ncbi:TrmH family RNA methyltransferase [Aquimarina longa]|uniref:TrmH family RNA methyltransferase n=1 Tax=Aquimarina longa TaxID=1080221 RepID=UPI000783D6CE|nr:TrmH family RNA methyltransferase [Aquimarina longa]
MNQQLNHTTIRFLKKQFPIILICDRVNSPANIGSIFRIADSFGIPQIYFCGKDSTIITSKRMIRTSRATHEMIPYDLIEDSITVVQELKSNGYSIFALEITETSIPVSEHIFKPEEKIALIIGEENFGVAEEILALVDKSLHINMYGNNSSMNVATATGIALYEITKQMVSE